MANADAPFGAIPLRLMDGTPWSGAMAHAYYCDDSDANNLFIGDPVTTGGQVNSTAFEAYPAGSLFEVIIATAGGGAGSVLGFIVGFGPNRGDLTKQYRVASTERIVYVADNPNLIFAMQEDSVGGALAAANAGLNADFIIGTGSTVTGMSATEIDSSSINTTNTLQLRVHRLYPVDDNAIGTNAIWEVSINTDCHVFKYTTGQ